MPGWHGEVGRTGGARAQPYLEDDSEEDHDDGRADEQVPLLHLLLVQKDDQSEGHGPAQAAVRHDHLVYDLQLHHPVPVQDPGLQDDTCGPACAELPRARSTAPPLPGSHHTEGSNIWEFPPWAVTVRATGSVLSNGSQKCHPGVLLSPHPPVYTSVLSWPRVKPAPVTHVAVEALCPRTPDTASVWQPLPGAPSPH